MVGKSAIFLCISTIKNITWTFNGKELPSNANTGVRDDAENQKYLELENLQFGNEGTYTCFSEKNHGVYSGTGKLSIYCK